ncbi:MAG: ribonuclease J [Desulfosalsimonadaceae bacterium]
MLKIIPLGGLGEIGLNMMVLECEDTLVVIDAGLMFPEDYMLGVDYVIPDMGYVLQNKSRFKAIVLTHAHEDHIGALPYLLREISVPVYGTPFTLGLIESKFEEHGLSASAELLHVIHPNDRLTIDPFVFEFIRVNHSVVDGVGIAIHTPEGLIVHTGDFKISDSTIEGMQTDTDAFIRCGDEGVLALLSDSTNVEREGRTPSDEHVSNTLKTLIQGSPGRVIVALFASNVSRIQQIVNIIKTEPRKIIFNGRSIELSVRIAKSLNLLKIPSGMEIGIDEIDEYPDEHILIMTTGSQGEPMSALARMSTGMHKQIKARQNDTVILSSKFIPGNEKAIAKIINNLFRKGANVIYEKISDIHVSGHAFKEELQMMMEMVRPTYFIPIHGEYRHLYHHARLAEAAGIGRENVLLAENGDIIEFSGGKAVVREKVGTSRVLVDGKGVGDVGRSVLKERRVLSEEGLVVINMIIDEETGFVIFGPEIVSRGFIFETESGHILEEAKCIILEIIEDISDMPHRGELLRKRLPGALREHFNYTIKRRPVILPFIIEL